MVFQSHLVHQLLMQRVHVDVLDHLMFKFNNDTQVKFIMGDFIDATSGMFA